MSTATLRTYAVAVTLSAWGYTGCGCNRQRPLDEQPASSASTVTSTSPAPTSSEQPDGGTDTRPHLKWYGWVGDPSRVAPGPVDTVWDRFAQSLPGYSVYGGEAESLSEWLRLLPLAAPGTPVRNYRGEIVVPGDDEHLAAVVAIDVGTQDIQQSADVIVRLHAEWRWFIKDLRMLYFSDSKLELPLQRWVDGERLEIAGGHASWAPQQSPQPELDHANFRTYLDSVFTLSDTRALLADSVALPPDKLQPGAFFVHDGHPAELLVVIDVATSQSGERAMLLARALSPSESIHVIRPNRGSAWFPVRVEQPVIVPRAKPFAWKDLRLMKLLLSPPKVACVGSLCPKDPRPSSAHTR